MLYLTSNDGKTKVIVLESTNLDELRKGRPAHTPDNSVLIAWTPDQVWLADQIMTTGGDVRAIAKAINEAAKRPEKPLRPYHKPVVERFEKAEGDT